MDLYDGEIKKLTSMLENHGAKRLPLQRVWEERRTEGQKR